MTPPGNVNIQNQKWQSMYERLVKYKQLHGDCLVPQQYSDDYQLGQWVNSQRQIKKNGKLTTERERRLEEIGFAWEPQWQLMFDRLIKYKNTHGDCLVPPQSSYCLGLWLWVQTQRKYNKEGMLSTAKKSKLDHIGFVWTSSNEQKKTSWDDMYEKLVKYKQINDDCLVPKQYSDDYELGNWVHTQRQPKKIGRLTAERQCRLDDIGFAWTIRKNQKEKKSDNIGEAARTTTTATTSNQKWKATKGKSVVKQHEIRNSTTLDCWTNEDYQAYFDGLRRKYGHKLKNDIAERKPTRTSSPSSQQVGWHAQIYFEKKVQRDDDCKKKIISNMMMVNYNNYISNNSTNNVNSIIRCHNNNNVIVNSNNSAEQDDQNQRQQQQQQPKLNVRKEEKKQKTTITPDNQITADATSRLLLSSELHAVPEMAVSRNYPYYGDNVTWC